jgi:hypothetical protein
LLFSPFQFVGFVHGKHYRIIFNAREMSARKFPSTPVSCLDCLAKRSVVDFILDDVGGQVYLSLEFL